MYRIVLSVIAVTVALVVAIPRAYAAAPCNHTDYARVHVTWWGFHLDHYRYLRTESVDAHRYVDVYRVAEHGTIVRSGVCP